MKEYVACLGMSSGLIQGAFCHSLLDATNQVTVVGVQHGAIAKTESKGVPYPNSKKFNYTLLYVSDEYISDGKDPFDLIRTKKRTVLVVSISSFSLLLKRGVRFTVMFSACRHHLVESYVPILRDTIDCANTTLVTFDNRHSYAAEAAKLLADTGIKVIPGVAHAMVKTIVPVEGGVSVNGGDDRLFFLPVYDSRVKRLYAKLKFGEFSPCLTPAEMTYAAEKKLAYINVPHTIFVTLGYLRGLSPNDPLKTLPPKEACKLLDETMDITKQIQNAAIKQNALHVKKVDDIAWRMYESRFLNNEYESADELSRGYTYEFSDDYEKITEHLEYIKMALKGTDPIVQFLESSRTKMKAAPRKKK